MRMMENHNRISYASEVWRMALKAQLYIDGLRSKPRQQQHAHHFGVEVVYVPTTAADMPPCCFSFRDCQLHLSATHSTILIFGFLRFWRNCRLAGSASFCMCCNVGRPESRLSAMVGCRRVLPGLDLYKAANRLTRCNAPAAWSLDKRLQVERQACGNV